MEVNNSKKNQVNLRLYTHIGLIRSQRRQWFMKAQIGRNSQREWKLKWAYFKIPTKEEMVGFAYQGTTS